MHEKSIDLLNKALADELAAVHQYMYFHFHCDDQGLDLLIGGPGRVVAGDELELFPQVALVQAASGGIRIGGETVVEQDAHVIARLSPAGGFEARQGQQDPFGDALHRTPNTCHGTLLKSGRAADREPAGNPRIDGMRPIVSARTD